MRVSPLHRYHRETRSLHPSADDDIGRTYAFKDYDAFLNVAALYCYQFKNEFSIPKGSDGAMKIGEVPDGYGGQQIFWGTYGANSSLVQFVHGARERKC